MRIFRLVTKERRTDQKASNRSTIGYIPQLLYDSLHVVFFHCKEFEGDIGAGSGGQ